MTGVLIVVLLAVIAAGQIVGGVYLIAGLGPALICLGILTFGAALLVRRAV
jgi:hypothetical protein